MYAAMDSRYSEAEVLVNAGADLNIQDLVRNPLNSRLYSDILSFYSGERLVCDILCS